MLHLTRHAYRLVLFSLLLLAGLAGCKDKDPKPTTGSIGGTVAPIGSVGTVQAIDAGGLTFPATPSPIDGSFSITDLKPGTYTLRAMPANGFYQPGDRQVNVEAGQTTNAGTIIVSSDGTIKGGTVSWAVNGTTYTVTNPQGSVDQLNHSFSLSATSTTGTVTDQLQIGLGTVFNGISDYTIGNSAYASAQYSRSTSGQLSSSYRSNSATNSGTFRVRNFDSGGGTMSGTFSLTLPADPGTGTTGSVTITNGTFNLRF